jgi:hypothetical protein
MIATSGSGKMRVGVKEVKLPSIAHDRPNILYQLMTLFVPIPPLEPVLRVFPKKKKIEAVLLGRPTKAPGIVEFTQFEDCQIDYEGC